MGVRWEPYPGAKGGYELRSKVRLRVDPSEITGAVRGKEDFARRRFRIKKDDLESYGYTAGCPGCRAVNRGTAAQNHTEECRRRISDKLEKVGDERKNRETERLFDYLREEERRKRVEEPLSGGGTDKEKTCEPGEEKKKNTSKPEEAEKRKRKAEAQVGREAVETGGAAASTGDAAMRGDEPRSRGGVPLGTDTSTMEECFKSVFGESTEEVADRERRGEIKRKSENRTEEEWEQMAKRL